MARRPAERARGP